MIGILSAQLVLADLTNRDGNIHLSYNGSNWMLIRNTIPAAPNRGNIKVLQNWTFKNFPYAKVLHDMWLKYLTRWAT